MRSLAEYAKATKDGAALAAKPHESSVFQETVNLAISRAQADAVTASILKALQEGIAPWRQPWRKLGFFPYNAFSGRPYRGLNVPALALQPFSDPRWLTFNQAKDHGGFIRRGAKGTPVYFWKTEVKPTGELDGEGQPVMRRIFLLRIYTVFNLEQTESLSLKPIAPPTPFDPLPQAEKLMQEYIARSGVNLQYSREPRAFYRWTTDMIHLPVREAFRSPAGFYATAFHEMGHSTGHPDRLARQAPDMPIIFGSPNYSKEELIAEFASAFLSSEVSIDNIKPNTAYIKSWLGVLRGDPAMLIFAASAGQRAANLIQGTTPGDEDSTEETPEAVVLVQRQGHHLSPKALSLEIGGQGDFIRERVADPKLFDSDSFRTVETGTHRVVIGCPKGQWDGKECKIGTQPQSILHPRGEYNTLVDEANKRRIPILEEGKPIIVNQADMAQLGPAYWRRFHTLAEEFKAEVGASCGCGEHAVSAMQAWHDAVSIHLGKPPLYKEKLQGFAQFLQEAMARTDMAQPSAKGLVLCPRHGCQRSEDETCPECADEEEDGRGKTKQDSAQKELGRLDWMPRLKKWRVIWYAGHKDVVEGDFNSREEAAEHLHNLIVRRRHPQFSQDWLRFLLYGAAGAAGATIAASVVNKLLTPTPATLSPQDTLKVVDDRKSPGVYSPKAVEGDQAQVDLGTLLSEIDTILKRPDTMGLIDPKSQRVLKKAG